MRRRLMPNAIGALLLGGVFGVALCPAIDVRGGTVLAQGDVIGVVVVMDIGDGQTPLVLLGGMKRDPVGLLRHVFANDPQARHVGIVVEGLAKILAPTPRVQEGRHEG